MGTQPPDPPVPLSHRLLTPPWWQLAGLAGTVAGVANLAVFAIAIWPVGVDVRELGPIPLTVLAILIFTVLPAVVATLLAAGLARWTAAPRRWFVGIAAVVLLLSFVPPLFLIDASVAALLMLELMHVIAAGGVVAVLAPRLANQPNSR